MPKIENEEPDQSIVKRVICKMCGATISYVPLDIKYSSYSVGDYDYHNAYILCPVQKCQKRIDLK